MPQLDQGSARLSRLLGGKTNERTYDQGSGPSRVEWRPGYLGPIPYLLVLRALVALGIVLRFWMHGDVQAYPLIVGSLASVFLVTTLVAFLLRAGGEEFAKVRDVWLAVVFLDVGVVSGFYWLTQNPQSDFFLFYYLPLFTAAEYLGGRDDVGGRYVIGTFILTTLAFLIVILTIGPESVQSFDDLEALFVRVYLPREVFFLAVSSILAFRLHREVATTSERTRLFSALEEVGSAAPAVVALNQELESMLDHLVDELGFEYATVSLVDNYNREVRAVRGRNVPPGWLARAVHSLDSGDIQSYVVAKRRTVFSDTMDDRFDPEIWRRYHHESLARVFAPLVGSASVIGVLEAGSKREKKEEVHAKSAAVERLGKSKGCDVERVLPHILLELVADHAARLIGADSASLHVFEADATLLVAGSSKLDRGFLRRCPPSTGGLGESAMRDRSYQVLERVPETKAVYAEGVRSMAAFPLFPAQAIRGVLYVHYRDRIHKFSLRELQLVSVFLPQMEVAIHNHLLFRQISRGAEEATIVAGLQNVIRSLSERPAFDESSLEHLLGELAANILHMLDARNVTLYEYFAQERRFGSQAVIRGEFEDESVMKTQVHPGDVVHQAVRDGTSLFIADLDDDKVGQFLRGPRRDGIDRKRFVDREGIRSCIVLILRSPYDKEVVGCLFANYRESHFDGNDGKAFRALAGSLAAAVAVAIQTRRLYAREISARRDDVERTQRELDALRAVDRAIVLGAQRPNLEAVYSELLKQALGTLKADAGDVTLWEPERGRLRIVTARGYPEAHSEESLSERVRLGCGIVGWVASNMCPFRTGDVRGLPRQQPGGPAPDGFNPAYSEVDPDTRSELAVPILEGDLLVGVINLEHKSVDAFHERDEQFLQTLAVQGAIAIHSVRQYGRLQRQLEQALALAETAERLLSSGVRGKARDIDEILRVVLTGFTAGHGLAFSRALVFVRDGDGLRGHMAVGSRSAKEAHDIWQALDQKEFEVSASGASFLRWQLDEAERQALRVAFEPQGDCKLSLDVQNISIALDGTGIVAHCFETKSPRILQCGEQDPVRHQLGLLYGGQADCALAFAPILLGDERYAMVVLDRRFNYNEDFIDRDCIPMLDAFARLTTMSIHSAQLNDQLASYERLENWKRAVDDVAHMLNTRLRRIGDDVGRVETQLTLREVMRARVTLVERVKRNVFAAERLVDTIARLGSPVRLSFGSVDIEAALRSVAEENPGCRLDIEPGLPRAIGDSDAIYDIFSELVDNARWQFQKHDVADAEVKISCRWSGGELRVEVSDNGPGVDVDLVEELFERGWSGGGGSGLGLAIASRLASEQGGSIQYRKGEPVGACFIVNLRSTRGREPERA